MYANQAVELTTHKVTNLTGYMHIDVITKSSETSVKTFSLKCTRMCQKLKKKDFILYSFRFSDFSICVARQGMMALNSVMSPYISCVPPYPVLLRMYGPCF